MGSMLLYPVNPAHTSGEQARARKRVMSYNVTPQGWSLNKQLYDNTKLYKMQSYTVIKQSEVGIYTLISQLMEVWQQLLS